MEYLVNVVYEGARDWDFFVVKAKSEENAILAARGAYKHEMVWVERCVPLLQHPRNKPVRSAKLPHPQADSLFEYTYSDDS